MAFVQRIRRNEAVDVVSPAPRDQWRKVLSADSGALLSHTPEWLDTICAIEGVRDTSRLYVWPSGDSLILPMVGKGLGDFALEESLPRGWGFGGLVGAGADRSDKVAAVYSDLIARRILRQRVCPNPLQGQSTAELTRWTSKVERMPSGNGFPTMPGAVSARPINSSSRWNVTRRVDYLMPSNTCG
jgi:hypothetical protein